MRSIWRQPIEITDEQTITAPGLGRVLTVGNYRAFGPEVWFEVDTEQVGLRRTIWVVGTGNPIPAECERYGDYVGHFYANSGRFVGHVYASRIANEVAS